MGLAEMVAGDVLTGAGPSAAWPPPFEPYGKTPKWRSQVIVTEKIDGTNVFIIVPEDPAQPLAVGSRNRYIRPGKSTDNFGFAAWVADHEQVLRRLGPGRHDGEWWGVGIGRGYGLTDRRWSLFQAHRWSRVEDDGRTVLQHLGLPDLVGTVPILTRGELLPEGPEATATGGIADPIRAAIDLLRLRGSQAVPGYMKPEGVIIAHSINGFKPAKYVFDQKVGPSPEEL